MGFGPGVEEALDELAGVAYEEEEGDAGEEAEEGGGFGGVAAWGVGWVFGAEVGEIWQIGGGGHGVLLGFCLVRFFAVGCWYEGLTPRFPSGIMGHPTRLWI
jgi:hypothetical protein